jgi:hypothetical protein
MHSSALACVTCKFRYSRLICRIIPTVDVLRRRNGASQTDRALPSQYPAKSAAPKAGSAIAKANAATTQTPANVNQVVNVSPRSNPQANAATRRPWTFQHEFVCRFGCTRGIEIQRNSRAAAINARRATAARVDPPAGIISHAPRPLTAKPTNALDRIPASVNPAQAAIRSRRALASSPRGPSVPASACPQRPAS